MDKFIKAAIDDHDDEIKALFKEKVNLEYLYIERNDPEEAMLTIRCAYSCSLKEIANSLKNICDECKEPFFEDEQHPDEPIFCVECGDKVLHEIEIENRRKMSEYMGSV